MFSDCHLSVQPVYSGIVGDYYAVKWFERQRIRFTLRHYPIPHKEWFALMGEVPVFKGLSSVERAHLRELTSLFLYRKSIVGVGGLTVSSTMAMNVAAQACMLILRLGLKYFDGWQEVLIYPGAFRVIRDVVGASGVVSREEHILSGESWLRGPVILSWDDVSTELSASAHSGHNVVIHEFAHKLDMLNGRANGMPPLHAQMMRQQWTRAFSQAFNCLQQQLVQHRRPVINAYGATDPAEFFAVVSEYFFTAPQILKHLSPVVYEQLVLFYRQDPENRLAV